VRSRGRPPARGDGGRQHEKIKHNIPYTESGTVARTALQSITAVLLCILVVGVAAATITAPLEMSDYDPDPDVRGPDTGEFWDFDLDPGKGMSESEGGLPTDKYQLYQGRCVPFLLTPWFYALAGLGLIGLFLFVRHRMGVELAVLTLVGVGPWLVLGHSWFTNCDEPEIGSPFGFAIGDSRFYNDTVAEVTRTVGRDSIFPPGMLGGLLILVIVLLPVVAFFGLRSNRSDDESEPDEMPGADEPLSGVARVAGDAADRIEGSVGDVDNEVFRAWRRMTEYVDVPEPKSSTPAEFARAARDAGMAEEDVALLTDLFQAVRYGGEEPTTDREQRAVEALREIETAYGEGGDEE
jgi:hypothetical protein